MAFRSLRASILALALAVVPAACGSSDDPTQAAPQPLTCQAGQFRLQGTLGGEPVDLTESSAGGGLTQVDTGELQIGDESPDPTAPPRTALHLVWAHGIVDGASTDASGTLVMRTGTFSGQTLCAGQGTRVTIYQNDTGVGLQLDGFASGAACDTPVTGGLGGCWR